MAGNVMNQFDFSESRIRKTNRNMLIFAPFLILCVAGFALFIADYKVSKVLIPLGVTFLIMMTILAIEIPLMNRSSRKMKVIIYEDEIIKQCGKSQQTISWDNIIKVKLVENPKGSLVRIRLYQKNNKAIYLFGFNEMGTIANLIKGRISNNVLVETKRHRLDWETPIISIISAAVTIIVMTIIASKGTKAMNIFAISAALCVGSWLLIYRPLTKFNLRNKWFEIISAVFMIIIGIYGFIVFLLTGKLT